MGFKPLKMLRRKGKKELKQVKETMMAEPKADPIVEDKLPEDAVVERVAMAPVDKQETIEEEADASTVESSDDPAAEDENVEPMDELESSLEKEVETAVDETPKEATSNSYGCCDGEVFKNLQAAVGLA